MSDYHTTYCSIIEKECGCSDCSICGIAKKFEMKIHNAKADDFQKAMPELSREMRFGN